MSISEYFSLVGSALMVEINKHGSSLTAEIIKSKQKLTDDNLWLRLDKSINKVRRKISILFFYDLF